MNDHSQRIIQIMQDKKMSATQFSEAIGIQRAAMSHITLGRNNPSADVITKIIERFEDVNPGWLLTGKGTMKILPTQPNDITSEPQTFQRNQTDDEPVRITSGTHKEADLFESQRIYKNLSHVGGAAELIPSDSETSGNNAKIIEKEVVIYKERPIKTIEKLVIFFSDKTFETFLPEVVL